MGVTMLLRNHFRRAQHLPNSNLLYNSSNRCEVLLLHSWQMDWQSYLVILLPMLSQKYLKWKSQKLKESIELFKAEGLEIIFFMQKKNFKKDFQASKIQTTFTMNEILKCLFISYKYVLKFEFFFLTQNILESVNRSFAPCVFDADSIWKVQLLYPIVGSGNSSEA